MAGDVVGVLLGAGMSKRLGRPKQTLPLGDTTVLGEALRQAEAATTLDRVVLVLGSNADDIRATLTPTRAEVVTNEAYGTGCASSLLAGLDAAGPDGSAIVMLLGDMPGLAAGTIDEVVRQWQAHRTWAAVTAYRDRLGHPFLFSAEAFPTLRTLHGDKAVWKIVDAAPADAMARISVTHRCPRDVDTWEEYEALLAEHAAD